MANPEHVALLWQGVHTWNRWRDENPTVRPDCLVRAFAMSASTAPLAMIQVFALREGENTYAFSRTAGTVPMTSRRPI
jgi:hypothetical protein